MTTPAASTSSAPHRLSPLRPRDTREPHRAASPLELLFDLTFAVAFSTSGGQFAHLLADGKIGVGIVGFIFSCAGIIWAWTQYTWFASAYDNDDWGFRVMSMIIMVGVVVMALGIPAAYESLVGGVYFDNQVMVAGYVIMRLAMLVGWGRAYRSDPERRPAIRAYVTTILVAQVGWVVVCLLPLPLWQVAIAMTVLWAIELAGPAIAEKRASTPWHPHHIVERYGLLMIITLGEGVIGTIAALSAVFTEGHRIEAGMIVVAGIGLTFGLWWVYFSWSAADILVKFRSRAFAFAYPHFLLLPAVAAVGAGLHVAGYWVEGEAHISLATAVATAAIPVGLFIFGVFLVYYLLHRGARGGHELFHLLMFLGSLAVVAASMALAFAGADLGVCLLVLMLAPYATVVGFEARGHRHIQADQAALLGREG